MTNSKRHCRGFAVVPTEFYMNTHRSLVSLLKPEAKKSRTTRLGRVLLRDPKETILDSIEP